MTVEEMDQEIARLDANLLRLYDQAIADCEAELVTERNPYHREFFQNELDHYRTMREHCEHAA
jgi:hypothetical protein